MDERNRGTYQVPSKNKNPKTVLNNDFIMPQATRIGNEFRLVQNIMY